MKVILSERNIVVVLFVMVLVTFSLAQEDSKKMEKGLSSSAATATAHLLTVQANNTFKLTVDYNSQ